MDLVIEKTIEFKAPLEAVWNALTDYQKFGQWFRALVASPFAVGQKSHCRCTYPGCEHLSWDQSTVAIEPMTYFAFRWPHADTETGEQFSAESITLVEFRLERMTTGTRMTIVESGFEALPEEYRSIAYCNNMSGWDIQATNIQEFLRD